MGWHDDLVGADLHGPSQETVENNTGSQLDALKVVTMTSIGTTYPNVVLISDLADVAAGVVQTDFATATSAKIMAFGRLNDIDTSSFSAAGVRLFSTAAGVLTETDTGIPVGRVLKKDASTGIIWVDVAGRGAAGATGPAGTPIVSQAVANINDPTPELTSLSGTVAGDALMVYEVVASGNNPAIIFTWDTSGLIVNPPFAVQGDGGCWVATTSVFFSRKVDEDLVSGSNFHGRIFHTHGKSGDPTGGRWWGKHSGAGREMLSDFRYAREAISGTEIDFYQGDRIRTKTLSAAPTAFTIINAKVGRQVFLEIDSGSSEDATFEASVTEVGDYDGSATMNYGTLTCLDGGTPNAGSFQITDNTFEAGDAIVLAGVTFELTTDWVAGANIGSTCMNIARAMEDSTDVAVKHLFVYEFDGTDTVTISERDSGSHSAFTLTKVDTGGADITIVTPTGGAEPAYKLTWEQEGAASGNKEAFFPPGSVTANQDGYSVRTAGSTAQTYFSGNIPDDFVTLVKMEVVCWCIATISTVDIDFNSVYSGDTEDRTTHQESDTSSTYNFTANIKTHIDVSGVFSSLAAGDTFGLHQDHNSIGSTIKFLGIKMVYST